MAQSLGPSTNPLERTGFWPVSSAKRASSHRSCLFARAPTLPAGDYKLHWSVRTMAGVDATQGDIPFTVKEQP
jgi:hypothetical protein